MHYYGNSSTNCIVGMLLTWGIPSCLLVISTSLNSKTFNATATGSLSVLSHTCMLNISIILWNIFSYHSYGKQYLDEGHLSHFALSLTFFGSLGAQTAAGAGGRDVQFALFEIND